MNATKTTRPTEAVNAAFEGVVKGYTESLNACLNAQRKMMDEALSVTEKTFSGRVPMAEDFRSTTNRCMNGSIELGTRTLAEMASVASEQAKFMGGMAERAADAMLGTHAARTPESMMATVRSFTTDCMERGTSMSEQLVRMGARNLESVQSLMNGFVAGTARTVAAENKA